MLNQDFQEFIQSLNDNQVRYLVVGGYAVALHGHPRYTKDLDVWIELRPENAAKMVKALDQFGFRSFMDESLMGEPMLGVGAGQWGEEILIAPAHLAQASRAQVVNLADKKRPVLTET